MPHAIGSVVTSLCLPSPPVPTPIERLRAHIRAIEQGRPAGSGARVLPFGAPALDRHLVRGGLELGRLHEIGEIGTDTESAAAGAGFAAGILARLEPLRPVLWVGLEADLYPPGLLRFGLDPGRLILVEAARDAEALAVLETALREGRLAAALGEIGALGPTAARRLQLACEAAGTTGFVLRRFPYGARKAQARETAAFTTRWRVTAIPSVTAGLPETCLGAERWRLDLAQRYGRPASWIVESRNAEGHAEGHIRVVAELADPAPDRLEPGEAESGPQSEPQSRHAREAG